MIDFGLARILRTSGFTTATSKGTWRYWAPERLHDVEGIQQITTATDVYAFSMAVVEVSISILLFFLSKTLSSENTDLHWSYPFPSHQERRSGRYYGYPRWPSSTRPLFAGHRRYLADVRKMLGR